MSCLFGYVLIKEKINKGQGVYKYLFYGCKFCSYLTYFNRQNDAQIFVFLVSCIGIDYIFLKTCWWNWHLMYFYIISWLLIVINVTVMNCSYKVISKKGVVQSILQIQKSKTCENATISCQMQTDRIYVSHKS